VVPLQQAIPTGGGALQRSTELQTAVTVAGGVASDHRDAGEDPGLTARCKAPCPAGRAVGWHGWLLPPAPAALDGHDPRNAHLLTPVIADEAYFDYAANTLHIHP